MVWMQGPPPGAHIFTVVSPLPLSISPPGSTSRHSTGPSWPVNVAAHLPSRHTRTVLQQSRTQGRVQFQIQLRPVIATPAT